ncbi:DUF998 domain-containing protein [Marinobacter fonticola]|uniref:DUF998 domain-containing protein n=1 Tax=Marinobacter fonticola TaxID=2603215 RepID=UPI0011E724FF|nr:DUF998 domain-containing protein [Marinobacter fonticola]
MKNCLESLVESLGKSPSFEESVDSIELNGHISTENVETIRLAIEAIDCSIDWNIEILDSEYAEIGLEDIEEEEVNLRLSKPVGSTVFFITQTGLLAALDKDEFEGVREIQLLADFEKIKTKRFLIAPWAGDLGGSGEISQDSENLIDPRWSLVRDLTGQNLPADPYRWICLDTPSDGSEFWENWKNHAFRKLATLLTSEIWQESSDLMVSLAGTRRRVLYLGAPRSIDVSEYICVAETVDWLLVSQDCEARHEVLVRRLANLTPTSEGKTLCWQLIVGGIVREALDGAKLDHRAYVRSKSAESVKAMAELRNTVSADVSKIADRAHRLSNGFVTGMAALAAGLGIRLTILSSRSLSLEAGVVFCAIVLSVIWTAVFLQRKVSSESLLNDLKHMRKWHRNVHVALTRTDYTQLALSPILNALRLYRRTSTWTFRAMILASIVFVALTLSAHLIITKEKNIGLSIPASGANSELKTKSSESE